MKPLPETPWITRATRPVYSNKWIALREDVVEMPNGRSTIYGVLTCGECVYRSVAALPQLACCPLRPLTLSS